MKKLAAALIWLVLCAVPVSADGRGFLGQPFPDFTAVDTQGNTFVLSEALEEHEAVLLNLWATWCPPCEAEMPFLNEACEQYGDRVAFIALSIEDEDSLEEIEAYRLEHGIAFAMGRDEGASLFRYAEGQGIPLTVMIDRFGNAAFAHEGSFMNAGEVRRVIENFLGDGYSETSVLDSIPEDTSTRAFPVSEARAIYVENENAEAVGFFEEGNPDPLMAYVVCDDTVHLRMEAASSDNPAALSLFINGSYSILELQDLLDPELGAYVYDLPAPDVKSGLHYDYAALLDTSQEEDPGFTGIYLIFGEEYIEELAEDMRSWGYELTWDYVETPEEEGTAAQAYTLYVRDQNGEAVPGVMVNFCTDTACIMQQADENGTIAFEGEPYNYHVQLLKAPEGYSFDPNFELFTGEAYGEWVLRIRKD